ncbi:MAG TPA: DUF3761 domain-containing protein [Steroidobacteraceae bacterium]|jgi:hypothetical protein|nr:DUF3761 domain-containing protein [Steroidobacteraceae bacterium]
MNKYNRVAVVAASLMIAAFSLSSRAADAPAPTTCKDGTTSSATGRGACSGHGGVQKAPKSSASSTASSGNTAAASAAPAAPAAAPAPSSSASTAAGKSASKSAPTATASNTDPTGATAKCKDGSYSHSQHHSGSCSSHGGVAEWLTPAK